MKNHLLALTTAVLLLASPMAFAQAGQNRKEAKEAWKREHKEAKESRKQKGRGKGKAKGHEARGVGNSLRFPRNTPRQLASVPKGHYPPPGMCRLWFPGLPPGRQRPPQPCAELQRLSFGDGAFILYNEKAYDMSYDWRKREAQRPASVPGNILDFYRNKP